MCIFAATVVRFQLPAACLTYCNIYFVMLPGNMGQCILLTVCGLNPHSKFSDTSNILLYL